MYMCMYIRTFLRKCVCMHAYMYININTHARTHRHTHTERERERERNMDSYAIIVSKTVIDTKPNNKIQKQIQTSGRLNWTSRFR